MMQVSKCIRPLAAALARPEVHIWYCCCRRSVDLDLATVWLHYDSGITVFDAGSTGRGMGGGWGVGECIDIGAAEGGRQAAPKADKRPFGESAPPPVVFSVGVT